MFKAKEQQDQGDGSDLGLFKQEHGGNDRSEREQSRADLREWERKEKVGQMKR